jgi:proline iminopeptidase
MNGGARTHFPEAWARFVSFVPKRYRNHPERYYWRMMNSKNQKTAEKYCREWALYETSMLHLVYDLKKAKAETRGKWVVPLSKLEAKYLMHDCFLPKNYIMRNVHKLRNIPVSIVHGRYDFVCTPDMAYALHKALSRSRLFFVTAGHSLSDPEIRSRTMKEIHEMARKHG